MIPVISSINWLHLASGDTLSLQVYKFIGSKPGKKAYIQANLHGAEIVGNAVIYQLIEFFSGLDDSQIEGEIWLVPVCNPLSTNQRSHFFASGRYNPYDGKDWNRIFWDYEKEDKQLAEFAQSQLEFAPETIRKNYLSRLILAWEKQAKKSQSPQGVSLAEHYRYQLQSLCLDADYLIDIHSSSNQSLNYLYCFQTREESAKYFLLDYGILMTEYDGDAFDEAFLKPWLALEKKLTELGKQVKFDLESWTLELGSGMKINPESVKQGIEGIKNYLSFKNLLKINQAVSQKNLKLFTKKQLDKYYAPVGGVIQNRVALGTEVKSGDKLYQIISFNKIGKLPKIIDVAAETDGLVFDVSTNESVNQGEYILELAK
jgi:predicted deacylase